MDEHQIAPKATRDARKEPISAEEALALAHQARRVVAAKGRRIVDFSLREGELTGPSTEEELRKAIIGPSGNLRAPSLWIGTTLCVGFLPEMYADIL